MKNIKSYAKYFWSQVDIRGEDDCWLWHGTGWHEGYGRIGFEGKPTYAHRVAYYLHYSSWPNPLARHTCNNPPCCNFRHIVPGTYQDNADDRVRALGDRQSTEEVATRTKVRLAAEWLVDYMTDRQWHPQEEIIAAAAAAGIQREALWRARKKLGLATHRVFAWRWRYDGQDIKSKFGEPIPDRSGPVPIALMRAEEVILSILTARSPQPTLSVMAQAKERGVSARTFQRARSSLRLYAQQINNVWHMSAEWVREP